MVSSFALRPGSYTSLASRRLMESRENFAVLFCQKHHLAPDRFVEAVLAETLYPHAHFLFVLFVWLRPDYGAADLDFIDGVGRLSSLSDFWNEAEYYAHHPRNFGFLRQRLRIRVSAWRMRRLMKKTLLETTTDAAWSSTTPWTTQDPAPIEKADAGAP
jgi:hypothetical protein